MRNQELKAKQRRTYPEIMELRSDGLNVSSRARRRVSLLRHVTLIPLLVFLSFPGLISAQESVVKFRRLSIEDGLSQTSVYCLFQDRKGFVWLGTEDGLNKYDGYNFKIYKNKIQDPNSLSYNHVKAILQDRSGVMWVGTYGGGLNRFEIDQERFHSYRHHPGDSTSLSNDFVNCLFEDPSGYLWIGTDDGFNRLDPKNGTFVRHSAAAGGLGQKSVLSIFVDRAGMVWIGTFGGGLNKFDPRRNQMTWYRNSPDDPASLSHDVVRAVFEDSTGTFWVGTEKGLNIFDRQTGRCLIHKKDPRNPGSLSNDAVNSIMESRRRDVWVGTADGLNRFDRRTGNFIITKNNPVDSTSLSNNEVFSLMEDQSGVLWVGTHAAVNMFDQEIKPFVQYKHNPNDPYSLSDDYIRALYEDRSNVLWVGGYAGLNRYDRKTRKFFRYTNDPADPRTLSSNRVMSLCEDRTGALWVGTRDGLNRHNRKSGTFQRFLNNPNDPRSMSSDLVRVVYEDREGSLWIGTEAGLNRMNQEIGKFTRYLSDPHVPGSLSNDYIYAITEDESGALWVGTLNGLNRLDRETGRFTTFMSDPQSRLSLSSSEILCLFVDHWGTLWIGTPGGLNKFDRQTKTFRSYLEKDGLPSEIIYSILEDDNGKLWMSSVRGLLKFDPQTGKFDNYDLNEALQGNEFNLGSRLKSRRGEMYFGGVKGFVVFRPEDIKENTFIPPIVITDFQIANKSVPVGEDQNGRTILRRSITDSQEVEVSYRDHVITFEFAALHFATPEKNRYAYIMEGFEKEWNEIGTRRFATYTNLPPRAYVFRVKGTNSDGLWNETGTSLRIRVTPPFWMTWWFRAAALLAVLNAIFGVQRLRTRKIRLRNRELETHVEKRTYELKEANFKLQDEISQRERAEIEIRRLKEFNERIVHNMAEGIIVNDLKGIHTFANEAAAKMLGYSPEELIGKHWTDIVPSDQRAIVETVEEKRRQGVSSISEIELLTREGRKLPVQVSGTPLIENGILTGTISVFADVSELKKAEEQKRLREVQNALIYKVGQRLGSTIELGPLLDEIVLTICESFDYYGVMLLFPDEEGKTFQMKSIAGGYADIFPRDLRVAPGHGMIGRAAVIGETQVSDDVSKNPYFVYLATEDTKSELTVPLKRGNCVIGILDIQSDEYNAFNKNDVLAMETLGTQIAGAIENAHLFEQAQREIAERRQAEAQLQKTTGELIRSNKELELFAYIASHDLQEPLRMVASYVQLISRRYKDRLDADAEEFIHFAVDGAKRMQTMINDLLTYSRVGRKGKPFAPTSLEAILRQATSNLEVAIEESRAVVTHNGLPTLSGDETQLIQLFQNLIGNAIKFRKKNIVPVIKVTAEEKNGEWLMSVHDNGIGIDPQYFERIFQIFQRLHTKSEYPGTGLGLAVCRKIVERHGGRIWVESLPGRGSAFHFTMPKRRDES